VDEITGEKTGTTETVTNRAGSSFRVCASLNADTTPAKLKELAAKLKVDKQAERRDSLNEEEKDAISRIRAEKWRGLSEEEKAEISRTNVEKWKGLSEEEKAEISRRRAEKEKGLSEEEKVEISSKRKASYKASYSPEERHDRALRSKSRQTTKRLRWRKTNQFFKGKEKNPAPRRTEPPVPHLLSSHSWWQPGLLLGL
jgi:hypothetical protein